MTHVTARPYDSRTQQCPFVRAANARGISCKSRRVLRKDCALGVYGMEKKKGKKKWARKNRLWWTWRLVKSRGRLFGTYRWPLRGNSLTRIVRRENEMTGEGEGGPPREMAVRDGEGDEPERESMWAKTSTSGSRIHKECSERRRPRATKTGRGKPHETEAARCATLINVPSATLTRYCRDFVRPPLARPSPWRYHRARSSTVHPTDPPTTTRTRIFVSVYIFSTSSPVRETDHGVNRIRTAERITLIIIIISYFTLRACQRPAAGFPNVCFKPLEFHLEYKKNGGNDCACWCVKIWINL